VNERLRDARILIVDDEESNVALLEAILERAGYQNVASTTDSREVETLFARTTPDLILLDLHMPEPDGFTLMNNLGAAREDRWFQVLVLTADAMPKIKERALSSGAADFLTKPFDRTEVLLRIENLLKMEFLQLKLRRYSQELEKRVYERTEDLNDARIEVLERLALAAEYRDDDTGEHARRVGRTAALIAQGLGVPGDEVALIHQAAPLHDIGKIGVPDAVLLKPGKLDASEFELMKTHAAIGGAILSDSRSRLLQIGEQIALSHHERWDGSGYPEGIRGDDIPLAGRVVAVADVFDALTHDRPYKTAWPLDQALVEIDRLRGAQFDPAVVESFDRLDHRALLVPVQAGEIAGFRRNGGGSRLQGTAASG
jgi:putative two-component system response regulator